MTAEICIFSFSSQRRKKSCFRKLLTFTVAVVLTKALHDGGRQREHSTHILMP